MRIVQFQKHGGPEVLDLTDRPPPVPGPGEVLIEVHAVSVNPVDWKIRAGRISHAPAGFPASTGRDGAGIVRSVGGATDHGVVGSRVCFLAPRGSGTWADMISLPADSVAPIHDNMSFVEAAALPLAGLSAWSAIETGQVRAGARVLIHGGSGGVGSIAVQLARQLGAHVSATCSARNADYVRGLGAYEVIAYDEVAFEDKLSQLDVVCDFIGGDVHRRSYRVLKPGGTLVYLNAAPIDDRGAEFGVRVVLAQVMPNPGALSAIVHYVSDGTFRPIAHQVLPFEEFRTAHGLIEGGHGPGKIVLTLR
jgi:NADPH:quinone reductase-like Zn-dependent oxidoreductase